MVNHAFFVVWVRIFLNLCVYFVPFEASMSRTKLVTNLFGGSFKRLISHLSPSVFSLTPKPLSQSLPITSFSAISARTLYNFLLPLDLPDDGSEEINFVASEIYVHLVLFEWSKFIILCEHLLKIGLREYSNW